jgi:hypothetical protein
MARAARDGCAICYPRRYPRQKKQKPACAGLL